MENLLTAVRDMMSSLRAISSQLEHEVRAVLHEDAEPDALAALHAEIGQLREALEGRGVIERAKGVLIAACGCDEDSAFQLLATRSRQERRKVRDIASEVLALATDRGPEDRLRSRDLRLLASRLARAGSADSVYPGDQGER